MLNVPCLILYILKLVLGELLNSYVLMTGVTIPNSSIYSLFEIIGHPRKRYASCVRSVKHRSNQNHASLNLENIGTEVIV